MDRPFCSFEPVQIARCQIEVVAYRVAIVERACDALGHGLRLRSTLGQGSCFAFDVDRHFGDSSLASPSIDANAFGHAIFGKLLLLVENDEDLANALTLRLERGGAHVVHASSAEEALEILEEIELLPDAALFDYQLGPGMDGVELHCIVKSQYEKVPTFILSADRSAKLKELCDTHNLPLVHKPIDIECLLQALDSVLRPFDPVHQ